ncbi:MAG: phenylalanine--tRNA ligase beta subunit-related protein [Aestuariivirga sp.]|nr:phenylalanine--tRNA ligase beta subunit-related protein [Aestuariivirga sp.]
MGVFAPIISPDIFALRPDFRALSIHALNVSNAESNPETKTALVNACNSPCSAPWAEAHREAWREAYRAFGAKPQRTPCSAEALLKRASRDGVLPSVNAVVDLYNAVSLRFAIPVGGENAETYVGAPRLVRAQGDEPFETMQTGGPSSENPEPGEVIWRDDIGVTCRRWNWRQGTRTRIEPSSQHMWFILEALYPMPDAALFEAGAELHRGLKSFSQNSEFEMRLVTAGGSTIL